MKPIFLIGYMGCGKTTLGRAVARHTGIDFIDLDQYIEGRYHKSISDIFAERGESGFREIERAMLDEVSSFEDVIVACGGGTPCFFDNMALMNSRGTTVFLNASMDALVRRLSVAKAKRPLIANLNDEELRGFIARALEARMPHYSQAAITFPSDLLENRHQIDNTVSHFAQTLGIKP